MKDTQTTSQKYDARMTDIRNRLDEIHVEKMRLMTRQSEASFASEDYLSVMELIEKLHREREDLFTELEVTRKERNRQWDYEVFGYLRPEGWFASRLNRLLGPLPEHSMIIEPTPEALASVKRYRLLALGTLICTISTLLAMVYFLPWTALSPYQVIYFICYWLTDSYYISAPMAVIISFITLNICASGIKVTRGSSDGKFWDIMALSEEQWFRRGAENWTTWQRFKSCAAFGFVHIVNIIYPVASIIVVGFLVGGIALGVYLAEYRRSQDSEKATLAATKFHATYNRFAVVYIVVVLVILITTPIVIVL